MFGALHHSVGVIVCQGLKEIMSALVKLVNTVFVPSTTASSSS